MNRAAIAVAVVLLVLHTSHAFNLLADESDCLCPRNYHPVCGTDDRTYSNECVFKCIQAQLRRQNTRLEIKFDGECTEYNDLL